MGTQPIHDSPCIIHGGPCDRNEAWERLYRSVLQQFRRSQRLLPRGNGGLHRCVLDLMCEESICSSSRSTECSIDLAVEAARGRVDERDLLGAAIGLAYAGLLVFSQDNRNRGKIQAALILDCSAWQPTNPAIYAHPAPLRCITLDRFKEWLARRPPYSGEVRDPSDKAKRWTFMRDAFTCAYCDAFCAAPEADQIVPQAVGGSDHPEPPPRISLAEFEAWLHVRLRDTGAPLSWERTRLWVFTRDGFTCVYCRTYTNTSEADHIAAPALGGGDHPDNLATACNGSKGALSAQEWLS